MYVARQVVTNSKGQKVEIYWNHQSYEDMCLVPVGQTPHMERTDMHWEIFLWGEPPIKPLLDFDLGVPNTWFEYEEEQWGEQCFIVDQLALPETARKFPSPRNPNCTTELWKSQEDLDRLEQMKDPNWVPKNLEDF
jgi:hypothetical protein